MGLSWLDVVVGRGCTVLRHAHRAVRRHRGVAMLPALALALPAQAELAPLVGPSGDSPSAAWKFTGLPQQKPPATRYSVREMDGRRVLRVESEQSYGNLVHPLRNVPAGVLSWRWRVDRPIASANLHTRQGDDAALKVCAMFDLPPAQVSFVERQLLRLAEMRTGTALPTATLCYVWEPTLPAGSVLTNAYTRRVRFITLPGVPGLWSAERRDLRADFLRAFGDESRTVPALSAIAVGADADNTGGHGLAWLDDLRHELAGQP